MAEFLLWGWLAWTALTIELRAEVRTDEGEAVIKAGEGVPGEMVMAIDRTRDVVLAAGRTDSTGRVSLIVAPGWAAAVTLMSARFAIARAQEDAAGRHRLWLRSLPPARGAGPRQAPVVRSRVPILLRGRVVDEGGRGLPEVRIDGLRATAWWQTPAGMRARGEVVSSALSNTGGAFVLPIPAGDIQVQPRAAGLVLLRSTVATEGGRARADRPILIMAPEVEAN